MKTDSNVLEIEKMKSSSEGEMLPSNYDTKSHRRSSDGGPPKGGPA